MTRFRAATILIAGLLAGGIGVTALVWGGYDVPAEILAPTLVLNIAVGWSFISVGVVAWRTSPASRTGLLMVLLGFSWFARLLVAFDNDVAFILGVLTGSLHLSLLVHLLVSYPTGRLTGVSQRVLVGIGYLMGAPLDAFFLVLAGARRGRGEGPPPNGVVILESNGAFDPDAISYIVQFFVVALGAGVVVLTLVQWRRWSPPLRRRTAPAVFSGVAITGGILLSRTALLLLLPPSVGVAFEWVAQILLVLWPMALLIGLLRIQFDRAAVGRLLVELGAGLPVPDRLRVSLATALHDPSVQISYWLPDRQVFVDSRGNPVAAAPDDPERPVTFLERHGHRIAALTHDPAVEPGLVRAVAAGAALAVDNERLTAELAAQLHEVRRSRLQIVEESDAARRQVERDLHDGSQQRLLGVALVVRMARSSLAAGRDDVDQLVTEARQELTTARAELSALARGISPAVLIADGLPAALDGLAARSAIPVTVSGSVDNRLPGSVEQAAYFVASEAIANAGKHSGASAIRVRLEHRPPVLRVEVADDGRGGAVEDGSGLRGLQDRIVAIGGRMTVVSPPGGGTRLTAEMPCA